MDILQCGSMWSLIGWCEGVSAASGLFLRDKIIINGNKKKEKC